MLNKYRLAQLLILFSILANPIFAQDATEITFRNNREMYSYNSEFVFEYDTIYGVLFDNEVSNYLETYQYDDGEFLFARIHIHKKITNEKGLRKYVFFVDKIKDSEIYSKKYKEIEAYDEEVDAAIKKSMKVVGKLMKKKDLNVYKETELYKKRAAFYPEITDLDLNKIKKKKVGGVLCFDYRKEMFLIHCYNKTLSYAKSHHGEFLSFYAIYNNKDQKVESVFVTITGFFME